MSPDLLPSLRGAAERGPAAGSAYRTYYPSSEKPAQTTTNTITVGHISHTATILIIMFANRDHDVSVSHKPFMYKAKYIKMSKLFLNCHIKHAFKLSVFSAYSSLDPPTHTEVIKTGSKIS